MDEPQTDAELSAALAGIGCRVVDDGSRFRLVNSRGGSTLLEADNLSDALFEAWHLAKP